MLLRASHPLFYAAISVLLWSSLATMARALGHIPPFLLLAWTFLIGCLLGIKHWKSWLANYRLTLFGTAGIFGYHFFLFSAFRNAPAIEANLINYLWPILMVLLSPLFIPAFKLRTNALLGSLIAFSGACLIVTGG
ncbi:MAG: EamA/RhaT family transporter, partial [Proteobacteria bacterium]